VADGVDPAVKGVEPARFDAVPDRPGPHSGGEQLRPSDHPVLPAGKRSDHLIHGKRDAFGPYSGHKASRLAHNPDRDARAATERARSGPKLNRILDKPPPPSPTTSASPRSRGAYLAQMGWEQQFDKLARLLSA
jgi:hypothetical protein